MQYSTSPLQSLRLCRFSHWVALILNFGVTAYLNAQTTLLDEDYNGLTAGQALPEWTAGVKAQSENYHSASMGAKVYTNIPQAWKSFSLTTGVITFEIWMKPKLGSDTNNGFHIGNSTTEGQLFWKNDQNKWWYHKAGKATFFANYDGNWHHFKVVYDTPTNRYDLYMDNSLVEANIQLQYDFSAGISKVGINSGRWGYANDTTSYFDDLKVVVQSNQGDNDRDIGEELTLIETNEFQEKLFLKPMLVSAENWRSVYEEFKGNFKVRVQLVSDNRNETTICIGLLARQGSGAFFETVDGGILILVPQKTEPDIEETEVHFYEGEQEIVGASLSGYKGMVQSVLSYFAPTGIPEAVEEMFKTIGVGKYDTSLDGTLFLGSTNHVSVDTKWDETRVQGTWAKPTRIEVKIPLSISLEGAQRSIENHGISLMAAVKTSIATLRVVFVVDRLGKKSM